VHPPVDDQGQTIQPELTQFEQLLDEALGKTTAAIDWDYAIATLKTANGMPVTVGLQADVDSGATPQTASAAASSASAETKPSSATDTKARTP
jgi:hypothetical protein